MPDLMTTLRKRISRSTTARARDMQELIGGMRKCFSGMDGYWGYEVCMGDSVKQFHHEPHGLQIEHKLGTHEPLEIEWRDDWFRPRRYTQHFVEGTGGRTTEVHYLCGGNVEDGLSSVRESPALHYRINVRLKAMCVSGQVANDQVTASVCTLALLALGAFWWRFVASSHRQQRQRNNIRQAPRQQQQQRQQRQQQQQQQQHDAPQQNADERPVTVALSPTAVSPAWPAEGLEAAVEASLSLSPTTPRPEVTPDLERTGECLICLEQMERSAIGSCPHHFCVHCLLETCRRTLCCPRCQHPITAVHLDAEFDALLHTARQAEEPAAAAEPASPSVPPEPSPSELAARDYVIRLRLPRGSRAGITLRTCRWRFGVAISALDEQKMAARSGLRVGALCVCVCMCVRVYVCTCVRMCDEACVRIADDVIVSMNGVPCTSHKQVALPTSAPARAQHSLGRRHVVSVPTSAKTTLVWLFTASL